MNEKRFQEKLAGAPGDLSDELTVSETSLDGSAEIHRVTDFEDEDTKFHKEFSKEVHRTGNHNMTAGQFRDQTKAIKAHLEQMENWEDDPTLPLHLSHTPTDLSDEESGGIVEEKPGGSKSVSPNRPRRPLHLSHTPTDISEEESGGIVEEKIDGDSVPLHLSYTPADLLKEESGGIVEEKEEGEDVEMKVRESSGDCDTAELKDEKFWVEEAWELSNSDLRDSTEMKLLHECIVSIPVDPNRNLARKLSNSDLRDSIEMKLLHESVPSPVA
ncbi:hypothetical protein T484DRAFT_1805374 [Baffinella frigidus]|nr:hypothetical protein T484DRAFT_1805374 [Cryptophyta sp. CCMP2293]